MGSPIVTLAICADSPHLDDDDRGLSDALRACGTEPRVTVWDDPDVDWSQLGMVVLRSVCDYVTKGSYSQFLQWTRSVPRLANHPDVVTWNSDKHYLTRLSEWGVPMIPTVWLEPEAGYSKHQVCTRFPAHDDFVVKPAVSSGGHDTGCYIVIDAVSRSAAINDAMHHLRRGRTVMVQRYLEEVDCKGEASLVYFNGVLPHAVEKAPMPRPFFKSIDEIHEEIVTTHEPSEQKWLWGKRVRKTTRTLIKEAFGRDIRPLPNRVDVVGNGQGGFYLMKVSLVDAGLYLGAAPEALSNSADAIAQRILW